MTTFSNRSGGWPRWWWHVLFWAGFAGLDFAANGIHYADRAILLRDTLLSLPILMGAAYFVGYVLVPQLLWRGRRWAFLGASLLVAVVVCYLRWRSTLWIVFLDEGYRLALPLSKVFKNVLRDYAVIALAVSLQIIGDWDRKDRHNRVLQREKQEAELQFLRAQIHPHFLFNTLNNLYGLALTRSERTAEGILRLSGLLDYILYECNAPLIPLRKELEVIDKYVELERLRYGERLDLRLDFDGADSSIPIAPLLLLPFVENCFKHGAAAVDGNCRIELQVTTDSDSLTFTAVNSRRPDHRQREGQSIGLQNVRRRLNMLYPNRHELEITEEERWFRVKLSIYW